MRSYHRFLIFSVLVLVLDFLELRLHDLRHLGKPLLLHCERQKAHVDDDGEENNGHTDVRKTDFADEPEKTVHQPAESPGNLTDDRCGAFGKKHWNVQCIPP